MNLKIVLILWLWAPVLADLETPALSKKLRKCRKKERYVAPIDHPENKTCEKCLGCPLGQEYDYKADRQKNPTFGFLECPPCKACSDGNYRSSEAQKECYPCKLNCFLQNREVQIQCGGQTPGKCGRCRDGFVPAFPNDNTSICILLEAAIKEGGNSKEANFKQTNIDVNSSLTVNNHSPITAIVIAVPCTVIAILVALGLFIFKQRKRTHTRESQNGTGLPSDSSDKLLSSAESGLGEDNLETDGPNNAPSRVQVRGEIPYSVCLEDVIIDNGDRPSPGQEQNVPRGQVQDVSPGQVQNVSPSQVQNMPPGQVQNVSPGQVQTVPPSQVQNVRAGQLQKVPAGQVQDDIEILYSRGTPSGQSISSQQRQENLLTKNSKELDIVASNISGDSVYDLFRHLGLDRTKYEPDKEIWQDGKQPYKDYILNSLIEWLKVAGRQATLEILCYSLKRAGFYNVSKLIMSFDEEKKPKTTMSKEMVHQNPKDSWASMKLSELIEETDDEHTVEAVS